MLALARQEAPVEREGAHIAMGTLTNDAPVGCVPKTKRILTEPKQLRRILKKRAKVSTALKNPM
jgi:hypothetical protein